MSDERAALAENLQPSASTHLSVAVVLMSSDEMRLNMLVSDLFFHD